MAGDPIQFQINGKKFTVEPGSLPDKYTLNDFIRENALLKGTKFMCKEGGCGACTVSVVRPDLQQPEQPVNSCLVPIHACGGWSVTTIEGLGNSKTGYNKIQQNLADHNGSQCGYCSPGMVMTMYGSLKQSPGDIAQKYESHFDGNICRCTGYRPIMDAMRLCADIEDLEMTKCHNCPHLKSASEPVLSTELKSGDGSMWYQPKTLTDLEGLVSKHSSENYYIVSGHTGVGVYKNDGLYSIYINIGAISDLHSVNLDDGDGALTIGAGVTLSQIINQFKTTSNKAGYSYLTEAARYLESVANLQVRNMASWAGNLMLKYKHNDFPSDVFTLLECVCASLTLYDCVHGTSVEKVSPVELMTMDMTGMIIVNMKLLPKDGWTLKTFKVMPRYRNAHTLLSMAFFVKLDSKMKVIEKPSIVFAGVAKSFAHAMAVEYTLEEKTLSSKSTIQACLISLESVKFDDDPLLPSVKYRQSLIKSLFYKAVLSLTRPMCKPDVVSGGEVLVRADVSSGKQDIQTDPTRYPLTKPIPKLDSVKQTAGEAQYIGDMPAMTGQLHAAFAKSTICSGDIKSIDITEAAAAPGVVSVLLPSDIPGKNEVSSGEPLLVEKTVSYYGQPVALVIAETEAQALAARELVKVVYENIKKPILSLDEGIAAKSFFPKPGGDAKKGDAAGAMAKCDAVVSGSVSTGEQYPMYTETQICVVQPEEGYYVVFAATQVISTIQGSVASLLGITTNEVEVKVRRVGGGFGGKQMRSTYTAGGASVAAYHTQRPVKMCLTLQDNMQILGRRQPIKLDYQVGVTKDMKIQAITGTVYENAGYNANEIMGSMLVQFLDNAYYIPNWSVNIETVKTNQPNHCYVRTPGIISMTHCAEQIIEDVAAKLQIPSEQVRAANFYTDGQTTPYNDPITPCYIQELWDTMKASADYDKRAADIAKFNSENMWKKKGLALMPLKYGMAWWPGTGFMVHVTVNYGDASVILVHGGVELGQGINTKAIQQAAHTLGISMDQIKVQPTTTTFNINCSATGGSVTSDMNCVGIVRACQGLLEKMKPYKKDGLDWKGVVDACAEAQVDLHSKYYLRTKDIVADKSPLFDANVFGTACTEVELDVLTGNYIIQRMDILYDCGTSYSPDIDVGQIEGGIVMGLGVLLKEQTKYDQGTGQLLTHNTWEYKVPLNRDIPVDLRLSLLKNRPNNTFTLSSKIVGEPPLLLAESAVLALRNCVSAFRTQQNKDTSFFKADAPFTVEDVLLALELDSTKFIVTD